MSLYRESEGKHPKNHRPDKRLKNYIQSKSLLFQEIESLNRRGRKPNLTAEENKAIQKERAEKETRTRTLANTKIQVLDDIIFPSMANLTYFFDAISNDPELENTFYSDIMELLGIKREHPRPDNYAFMYVTLIHGMISTASGEYEDDDFRIRLIHELLKQIWYIFQILVRKTFPLGIFSAFDIVNQDMNRVLAWTELIASKIPDEYDFKNVTAPESIPVEYLKDENSRIKHEVKRTNERWEEFDSNQLKPKRTIIDFSYQ